MTHTPETTSSNEQAPKAVFATRAEGLLEDAESFNPTQIANYLVKPLFDDIDTSVIAGEITRKGTEPAWTPEAIRDQFAKVYELLVEQHADEDHKAIDFNKVMQYIPSGNGLRDAMKLLLNNSLTERDVLSEIYDRYVVESEPAVEQAEIETIDREKLAIEMGGRTLDSLIENSSSGVDPELEHALSFKTREEWDAFRGRANAESLEVGRYDNLLNPDYDGGSVEAAAVRPELDEGERIARERARDDSVANAVNEIDYRRRGY